MASAPIGRRLVSSRARASPRSPLVAHIDTLDLVLTSPAVCVRRQHWPWHCLRQDVPVRRAQRHRPGRQRYLEVDEPGGLEEKGSPCLLVQAPQCFGCYIQTVYMVHNLAVTEQNPFLSRESCARAGPGGACADHRGPHTKPHTDSTRHTCAQNDSTCAVMTEEKVDSSSQLPAIRTYDAFTPL